MKSYGTSILVVLVALALPGPVGTEEKREEARTLHKEAQVFLEAGDAEGALEKLKAALRADPSFAPAHNLAGEIYLNLASRRDSDWDWRYLAQEAFERALHLDMENTRYWLNMGVLRFLQGARHEAERVFNRILGQEPENARAYYYLGRIYLEWAFQYQHLKKLDFDMSLTGGSISLDPQYHKFMARSEEALGEAVEREPSLLDAHLQLALCRLEVGDFEALSEDMERVASYFPEEPGLYLLRGLAHYRQRLPEKAYQEFIRADSLMTPDERQRFLEVNYLLPEEVQREDRWQLGEVGGSLEGFWKGKDPLFLTPYNERLLEHYSRLAYVNLRFRSPELGLAGRETDRGRIYIRYGPPEEVVKVRGALLWRYPSYDFLFEDQFLSGQYRLSDNSVIRNIVMARRSPDGFATDLGGPIYSVADYVVDFRGATGKSRAEVYFDLPLDIVDLGPNEAGGRLRRGLFLFDKNWEERYTQIDTMVIRAEKGRLARFGTLKGVATAELPGGDYRFGLEFQDLASGRLASTRGQTDVRIYTPETLAVSDILLCEDILPAERGGAFIKGPFRVVPNVYRIFPRSRPVHLYYEIYDLLPRDGGQAYYRVEYTLRRIKKSSGFLGQLGMKIVSGLGSFLGAAQGEEEVTLRLDRETSPEPGGIVRETISLDLAESPGGDYELEVGVTDLSGGVHASSTTWLSMVEQ